jgi:glycerol-3-phosphate acyltransferase PlsY
MIFLTLLGFLLGSMMWSYWLGKYLVRRDLRQIGDGNPGAFNLMKTGDIGAAGLGVMLDIGKGVIPTGLAMTFFPVEGWELVPVAIAPIVGHAFSPFLNFKGGKAVAVTGGVHIGLQPAFTLLIGVPLFVLAYRIMNTSGWAVALSMGVLTALQAIFFPSAVLIVIWILNLIIVLYKYRDDLRVPPRLKR